MLCYDYYDTDMKQSLHGVFAAHVGLEDAKEKCRELSERHGRVTLYETYQAKRTIETFEKGKAND